MNYLDRCVYFGTFPFSVIGFVAARQHANDLEIHVGKAT